MYGYAASSAAATQLTPFAEPQQTTSPGGLTAQSGAVSQAGTQQATLTQLISTMPNALQGLASPTSSGSGLDSILDGLDVFAPGSGSSSTGLPGLLNLMSGASGSAFGEFLNDTALNSIFASGFYMPKNFLGTTADLMGLSGKGAEAAAGDITGPAASALENPLGSIGALGDSASAGLGQAGIVGPLSVPLSWTTPAPLHSPLSSTLGAAPIQAPAPAEAASTPPVPLANMGAQGEGRAVPQYGFRPSFVARPPAAG